VRWSHLTEEQRHVLLLASEESTMYELRLPSTTLLPDQPSITHPGLAHDVARRSLAEMIDAGLVWMYWPAASLPDLTDDEVLDALDDPHRWELVDGQPSPRLYITASGERVLTEP
jgi:hypothetical protein